MAADRFYFYCHETLKHARPGIVPAEMLIGIKTMKYYYTCILIRLCKCFNLVNCNVLTFTQPAFLMIELYLQYNLTIVMKADKRTYQIVTRVWEEGHTIG